MKTIEIWLDDTLMATITVPTDIDTEDMAAVVNKRVGPHSWNRIQVIK